MANKMYHFTFELWNDSTKPGPVERVDILTVDLTAETLAYAAQRVGELVQRQHINVVNISEVNTNG